MSGQGGADGQRGSNTDNGVSINFDAQALHDAEEAEYQREEQQQQREVSGINNKQ